MKTVAIIIIILVLGLGIFKALFMVIWPSKWFDLPDWISLRGYFNRES